MNVTTLAARGAAALVAAVAGAASYEHIYSVAYAAGERSWVAAALPLAIDGLIVVGVSALLEDRRNRVKARLSARVAVLVGVVATIAANVASAEPHLRARLVAVAAPVAFLLAVEVLTRRGRSAPEQAANLPLGDDSLPPDEQRSGHVDDALSGSRTESRPRVRRRAANADRVAKARTRTPDATPAEVAARLRLSERTVTRYWDPTSDGNLPPANGHVPAETPTS